MQFHYKIQDITINPREKTIKINIEHPLHLEKLLSVIYDYFSLHNIEICVQYSDNLLKVENFSQLYYEKLLSLIDFYFTTYEKD